MPSNRAARATFLLPGSLPCIKNLKAVLATAVESSSLKVLVNMLANTLGSPVVDKTGLDGLYDYTFEWPDGGSSLFASVDQLGLKLEARKEQVEVLVMDRAEHPSAN